MSSKYVYLFIEESMKEAEILVSKLSWIKNLSKSTFFEHFATPEILLFDHRV